MRIMKNTGAAETNIGQSDRYPSGTIDGKELSGGPTTDMSLSASRINAVKESRGLFRNKTRSARSIKGIDQGIEQKTASLYPVITAGVAYSIERRNGPATTEITTGTSRLVARMLFPPLQQANSSPCEGAVRVSSMLFYTTFP